jgi:uncharacterized protein
MANPGPAASPLGEDFGTSREGLRLAREFFVVPDGGLFPVYAPRKKGIALVNGATIKALQGFSENGMLKFDERLIAELVKTGILIGNDDVEAPIRFPEARKGFDPAGLSLFLTTKCSMACTYCYAEGGSRPKSMSWRTARAAIDWIVRHTISRNRESFSLVFHGGGDVGSAKGLLKRAVHYARSCADEHGLSVRIEAGLNGVLDRATVDWIAANLNGSTVSLDGIPMIQNRQRLLVNGRASFERVAATLRRMDELGFSYGIRMTVTADGLPSLPDSAEFVARSFSARAIQVESVFTAGRAINDIEVDPQEFVRLFREARQRVVRLGKALRYSGALFDRLHNQFYKVSDDSLAITADGLITACYEVAERDDPQAELFVYGRFDTYTGEPLLDDSRLRRLRTLKVENKPGCSTCFCKWHCAGECAAKLAHRGDAWDPAGSSRCYINRELTKDLIRKSLVKA